MDKTTLAATLSAVGFALAGSGLTEIAPEFITELVPMWARQAGAIMFLVGLALTGRFALDRSTIRQVALNPEDRKDPPDPPDPPPAKG